MTGVSTFTGAIDANAGLDVDGQSDLDEVVVAGVSTFNNTVDINAGLDVDGQSDLDEVVVAGVSTFSSLVDVNNRLDVVGGANIDQANVSGVSTLTGNVSLDPLHFSQIQINYILAIVFVSLVELMVLKLIPHYKIKRRH